MHNALKATPELERRLAQTDWSSLLESAKKLIQSY